MTPDYDAVIDMIEKQDSPWMFSAEVWIWLHNRGRRLVANIVVGNN